MVARSQLGMALRRARWTIFWERLWPALARLVTVIGLFLTVSWLGLWLWLPPLARAAGLSAFRNPCARGDRSIPFPARARRRRCAAPARSRQRRSTSAGDDDRRRTRRHVNGSLFARVVAGARGAHPCRGPRIQGGMAVAPPFATRSLCAARSRSYCRDRNLHRRRRRALEARRGGVRLAGRCAAGEFPRRCLGRRRQPIPASRRSCSPACIPARSRGRTRMQASRVRSRWQHARCARDGQAQSRHCRQRRRHASRRKGPGSRRHTGVSVQDRDDRQPRLCAASATI